MHEDDCPFIGVHLAVWGRIDTAHGMAMDMTLGLPAASLASIGLRDLPPDYVFTIPLRGTANRPEVNWAKCARQPGVALFQCHAL